VLVLAIVVAAAVVPVMPEAVLGALVVESTGFFPVNSFLNGALVFFFGTSLDETTIRLSS